MFLQKKNTQIRLIVVDFMLVTPILSLFVFHLNTNVKLISSS